MTTEFDPTTEDQLSALRGAMAALADFYQTLQADDIARLHQLYSPEARFKDPFNEVQGIDAIARIFHHMFHSLHDPRFTIDVQVSNLAPTITKGVLQAHGFMTWRFDFALKAKPNQLYHVRGATHLQWQKNSTTDPWLLQLHRDYWDVAEELYAKLPVLGWLMRRLQKKLSASEFKLDATASALKNQ